jgi:photosystem II PsbU protein
MNSIDAKLGTSHLNKVDLNTPNHRAFMPFPGLYPVLARLITKNGPYSKVEDVLSLPGLTEEQKSLLTKNLPNFYVEHQPWE